MATDTEAPLNTEMLRQAKNGNSRHRDKLQNQATGQGTANHTTLYWRPVAAGNECRLRAPTRAPRPWSRAPRPHSLIARPRSRCQRALNESTDLHHVH